MVEIAETNCTKSQEEIKEIVNESLVILLDLDKSKKKIINENGKLSDRQEIEFDNQRYDVEEKIVSDKDCNEEFLTDIRLQSVDIEQLKDNVKEKERLKTDAERKYESSVGLLFKYNGYFGEIGKYNEVESLHHVSMSEASRHNIAVRINEIYKEIGANKCGRSSPSFTPMCVVNDLEILKKEQETKVATLETAKESAFNEWEEAKNEFLMQGALSEILSAVLIAQWEVEREEDEQEEAEQGGGGAHDTDVQDNPVHLTGDYHESKDEL